ncbi:MAG: ribonuclease P protein component 1 [Candidatus Thermoplasmatota archaeon]
MRRPENLVRHELIGLRARVAGTTHPGYMGIAGRVVDETMKTLVIDTGSGRKRVPKSCCTFVFELDGRDVEIQGRRIVHRPEERTKKAR